MIKNGTVLQQLNETTLPMYILQSLPGHLPVIQSLICFLNNSSDVVFLIAIGANSHISGARQDMVSAPKYTGRLHFLFRVELSLRSQVIRLFKKMKDIFHDVGC